MVPEQQVVTRPLGRPGDLGWVVMAHGEVHAAEFGWNTSFEALVAARGIYLAAGFALVEQEPHTGFGVDLVGQVYELYLRPGPHRPGRPGSADIPS